MFKVVETPCNKCEKSTNDCNYKECKTWRAYFRKQWFYIREFFGAEEIILKKGIKRK